MPLKTCLFLMLALGIAKGATITSTFGPGDSFTLFGGYQIGGGWLGSGAEELAVEFTPSIDEVLTQVRVAVFDFASKGDRDLVLDFSQGPVPSAPIETFATTVEAGGEGRIYSFNSSLNPKLQAGQNYWIVLTSNDLVDNDFAWNLNTVGSYSAFAGRSSGQTLWESFYNASPAFDVSGQPVATTTINAVPEPSTAWMFVTGLVLLAVGRLRRCNKTGLV